MSADKAKPCHDGKDCFTEENHGVLITS